MSVGDVIKINNSFYICRKMGFSKIIQDEELSADLETTTELLNQNS